MHIPSILRQILLIKMKLAIVAAALTAAVANPPSFAEYRLKHTKTYTPEEAALRKFIYNDNVARIEKHNAADHSWKMAVNKFADLHPDEFAARYALGYRFNEKRSGIVVGALQLPEAPASIDWVAKGAVIPVKNQGQCGSCWAFSTTGAVEGLHFIKTGKLVSLSEQQLVDCSSAYGNHGCNGGLMDYAFQYIANNKGICSEAAYPYKGQDMKCQKGCTPVATVTGFRDVAAYNDAALTAAIAQQPVSVAIQADQHCFQFYSSGVLNCPTCGNQLNHGVLAVGYGVDGTTPYYTVKNSWGADWGDKGYIRLLRGPAAPSSGECGILLAASYPTA